MTHQEIHRRALDVSRCYRRSVSEMIDILQVLDARKTFREYECTSLYQYATEQLGMSEDTACNFIAVARKTVAIPALKQAIASGAITMSKARKMCSVITTENQDQWLALAKKLPTKALEREVARVNPKAAVAEQVTYVTADRMKLVLGVSEEFMEKLKRAQDLEAQSKQRHRDYEATLEAVLDLYLERNDPVIKAERVNAVRPATRRIKHESAIQRKPLSARLVHAVNLRDQGRCVKCGTTRWLDFHHVVPKERGGADTLENLITLCRAHHRQGHLADNTH